MKTKTNTHPQTTTPSVVSTPAAPVLSGGCRGSRRESAVVQFSTRLHHTTNQHNMINEKILIETLANHTERLADLQQAFAGLTALVESRLPNLSPEEKEMLKNGIKAQMSDAESLKSGVTHLRQALQNL